MCLEILGSQEPGEQANLRQGCRVRMIEWLHVSLP
jgi:hypothetical protein